MNNESINRIRRDSLASKIIACLFVLFLDFTFGSGLTLLEEDHPEHKYLFIVDILFIFYILGKYIVERNKLLDTKNATPLNQKQIDWLISNEKKVRNLFKVEIKYIITNIDIGLNASVVKKKSQTYIILTSDFFMKLNTNEQLCRTILFHEYGHIYSDDWVLYVLLTSIVDIFKKVLLVYLAILLFLIMYNFYLGQDSSIFYNSLIVMLAKIIVINNITRVIRYRSEYRADIFSYYMLKDNCVLNYLESLIEKKKIFRTTPTGKERVDNLKKYIKRFPN
jgi:Zn-dependent protease with chaperone function